MDPARDLVAFPGFLGTGNLGNDASLLVVVDAIRRRRPTAGPRVLPSAPPARELADLPTTSFALSRSNALGGVLESRTGGGA